MKETFYKLLIYINVDLYKLRKMAVPFCGF